jgi:hypothetical protein
MKLVVGSGNKIGADVVIVVEFTIDDGMNTAVFRVERLDTIGGQIIYGETNVAESCVKESVVTA